MVEMIGVLSIDMHDISLYEVDIMPINKYSHISFRAYI